VGGASFQHRPTTDLQYADSKAGTHDLEFPHRGMQGGIKEESKGRDRHPPGGWRVPLPTTLGVVVGE